MKKLYILIICITLFLVSCDSLTTLSSTITTTSTTTASTLTSASTITTNTTSIATTTTPTTSLPVSTANTVMTPFEIVSKAKDDLDLNIDYADVRYNLVLPKEIELGSALILISWSSNDKAVVNDEGQVNRPQVGAGSASVTLTATFQYSGTIDYRDFFLTIPELPDGDLAQVEEAANALILWPEEKLNRDFLVLPRIADFATHIEWISSDPSLIDLEGNVTLPNFGEPDETVTLSATISLGQAMVFRDYRITLTAKDPYFGVPITLEDDRILNVIPVTEKIGLLVAILNAQPGDAIVLENGNYYDVNFEMVRSGTADHPIFILARHAGRAIIQGESQLRIKANHVIIANLSFQNGRPSSDTGVIFLEGNYLRLTNTLIDDYDTAGYDYKWVSLTGKYHEIDNNTFTGKETGGSLLTIWRNDTSPQFHNIHHNQFLKYKDAGGANGYETIRVGTSVYSQSDSYVIIEQNLFEEVSGEIEIISIKSGRVLIRGNTFIDSLGHVTSRHGKNNVIEDNVFLGHGITDTGGIRAYDGGHIIRNNYVDSIFTSSNTRAGIVIHSGVNIPGTNTVLNAQWTSFYMLIENNTFVNCRQSILFDGKYSYPANDPVILNNLIVAMSGYTAVRYDKLPVDAIFENNYFYSDSGYSGGGALVNVPIPSGVTFSSSLLPLTINAEGLYLDPLVGAYGLQVITHSISGVSWLRNAD